MQKFLKKNKISIVITLSILILLIGSNKIFTANNQSAQVMPLHIYLNKASSIEQEEFASDKARLSIVEGRTYVSVEDISDLIKAAKLMNPQLNNVGIEDCGSGPNLLLNTVIKSQIINPFEQIKPQHFMPVIEYALAVKREKIAKIINNFRAPSFENTIEPLEKVNMGTQIYSILFTLNISKNRKKLKKAIREAKVCLSEYNNNIYFNKKLFDRVAVVYKKANREKLTTEQATLLENTYQKFIRNGVNLPPYKQARLQQIDSRLVMLSSKISNNLLEDTNATYLQIKDEKELSGLPDYLVSTAAHEAMKRDIEGWCFTMDNSIVAEFLSFADNREKRKEMMEKSISIGKVTPETDNSKVVEEIVNLRLEKANILGFATYADYILEERMAKDSATVMSFLNSLVEASLPVARENIAELQEYAKSKGLEGQLEIYDWSYYERQLRQERYSFDQEELRPYFELGQVKSGVFELAKRLFGLEFIADKQIQNFYPDIEAYAVYDETDRFLGMFYFDLYYREDKNSGAWTTSFRMQEQRDGEDIRPLVSLVYDFPLPDKDGNCLLSFYDLITFLHEFGHGLHFLFSDVRYASLSTGGNICWDFVELPSNLMENWAYEKEFLHLFARHYQTGELIPDEMVERLNQNRTVRNAPGFLGGLQYSLLDMAWHTIDKPLSVSIAEFEEQALKDIRLLPPYPGELQSINFSHLFDGSYAAGYYCYIWANVLEAEVYQEFENHGIMNRKTGEAFRQKVLSKGASIDPMALFTDFVGRQPSTVALLKREGFC